MMPRRHRSYMVEGQRSRRARGARSTARFPRDRRGAAPARARARAAVQTSTRSAPRPPLRLGAALGQVARPPRATASAPKQRAAATRCAAHVGRRRCGAAPRARASCTWRRPETPLPSTATLSPGCDAAPGAGRARRRPAARRTSPPRSSTAVGQGAATPRSTWIARQPHELGEAAGIEARAVQRLADAVPTGQAVAAAVAGHVVRGHDAIAGREARRRPAPTLFDRAGDLVAQHQRRARLAVPLQQVRAADAAGLDAQQQLARPERGHAAAPRRARRHWRGRPRPAPARSFSSRRSRRRRPTPAPLVHDRAHGADHAHRDSRTGRCCGPCPRRARRRGSRSRASCERVALGDLLASGDHERHGRRAHDLLEALAVVGLDHVRADARRRCGRPGRGSARRASSPAHRGDGEHGDAVALALHRRACARLSSVVRSPSAPTKIDSVIGGRR